VDIVLLRFYVHSWKEGKKRGRRGAGRRAGDENDACKVGWEETEREGPPTSQQLLTSAYVCNF